MNDTCARELSVSVVATGHRILDRVSIDVRPGEIHGLAGETGSGKTTLGLALLGYLASGLRFGAGTITAAGHPIRENDSLISAESLDRLRGETISYVPQDASSALNPGMRIGRLFREVMHAHGVRDKAEQQARIDRLIEAVGLPADGDFASRFPHQLSGGQLQRIGIAIAFVLDPAVVIMDEPTTGLDVTTKQRIAALVRGLAERTGTSIVFVSHDLRLLLDLSDKVSILLEGRVVDQGTPAELLHGDTQPYTRRLLNALPTVGDGIRPVSPGRPRDTDAPLRVEELSARYGTVTATHGLSFTVEPGRALAVVGESGSGKTTTARCIAGFHPDYAGTVSLGDETLPRDVARRSLQQKAAVQYVFQNPYGSLNPRRRVGHSIALASRLLARKNRSDAERIARIWLGRVGLSDEHFDALPAHLSGGQRQRVALARALAAEPGVLVCDEVTSSLDVSVQREIVTLLQEIQEEHRLSMLFITHDLALAHWIAHDTLVLLRGSSVEQGPTSEVLSDPVSEYTRTLVKAGTLSAG